MGQKVWTFSQEDRVEQLKKCCETIIEKAEQIMADIDLTHDRIITIEFPCREYPVIKVEHSFLSKKMLDDLL